MMRTVTIPEGLTCKNGHKRTIKNTYIRPPTAARSPGTIECRICKAASQLRSTRRQSEYGCEEIGC